MLYPPIVASSMPAFDIQKGCRVYFTLSGYNSPSDVQCVHVSVRRPSSNRSVIRSNYTTSKSTNVEFIAKTMTADQTDTTGTRYYITLSKTEINFSVNQNYKVQLRLSSLAADDQSLSNSKIDGFGNSEWSTACMIRPINPPSFYIDEINDTDQDNKDSYGELYFYNTLADFNLIYTNKDVQGQILRKYRLRLYSSDNQLLADSGIMNVGAYNYTNNTTSIQQFVSLPYEFIPEEGQSTLFKEYKMLVWIQTHNGYEEEKQVKFTANITFDSNIWSSGVPTLHTIINEEECYIKVNITGLPKNENYILRRTDSSSKFHKWEDIKFFQISDQNEWPYQDFTVESGILYQYLVQNINTRGRRSTPQKSGYVEYEPAAAYLYQANGQQLKLKYDFTISSYKTNVAESKTDTIGSQYPFIRRNGSPYYRSFGCSGIIVSCSDTSELLATKKGLNHGQSASELYDEFQKGTISTYVNQYDYTYERKFREKVEEFLYNAEPKLYKSMQEGNMIIKLMDISLSPKTQLGRLFYTFSATAYQIDECNISNYIKYGFIDKGTYNKTTPPRWEYYPKSEDGSVMDALVRDDDPVLQATDQNHLVFNVKDIGTKYHIFIGDVDINKNIIGGTLGGNGPASWTIAQQMGFDPQGYDYGDADSFQEFFDFKLTHLKITVYSKPRLIRWDGSSYHYVDKLIDTEKAKENIDPTYAMTNKNFNNDLWLGTIINTNRGGPQRGQIIISLPNQIYELTEKDLEIGKDFRMSVPAETALRIEYTAKCYYHTINKENVATVVTQEIGQIQGTGEDLVDRIKQKYTDLSYKKGNYQYDVIPSNITLLSLQTEPGITIMLNDQSVETYDSGIIMGERTLKSLNVGNNYTIVNYKLILERKKNIYAS